MGRGDDVSRLEESFPLGGSEDVICFSGDEGGGVFFALHMGKYR